MGLSGAKITYITPTHSAQLESTLMADWVTFG